jgi:arginine/lysine/ornithine decarboxylase
MLAFKEQITKLGAGLILSNNLLTNLNKTIDPWKLCLSFNELGLNGYEAEYIFRTDFGIQAEYADLNQVTFFMAPWQCPNDLEQLLKALTNINNRVGKKKLKAFFPSDIPPLVIQPRRAAIGPSRLLNLHQAVGKVSAAVIAPYPPGIPLIGPGELIRQSEVDFINQVIMLGGNVRGVSVKGEVQVTICG